MTECISERFAMPYAELGTGEPVVLVHGSNSDQRIWTQHQRLLASRYRVLAVSQRYFGSAPWLDSGENFSISVLADDLASFIEGMNAGPVSIVGWSFGGAVALTMAARNRGLVKKLVLYEPSLATFVTAPKEQSMAAADRMDMMAAAKPLAATGDLAGAVRMFMDGVNAEVGAFDGLAPEIRSLMIENSRMLPLLFAGPPPPHVTADDLRRLDIPSTIVVGRESRVGYQIAARGAHGLLSNSTLEVVDGARHLWPVEDADSFSQLILNALAGD